MSAEAYIIWGVLIGLLFTELTNLSPGGIIVPGYIALFLHRPLEIILTVITAAAVMLCLKLASHLFFIFGRRRYALCLIFGVLLKLAAEYFFPTITTVGEVRLIGYLIPGIIAYDMHKQGIPKTLLAASTVTALVFLLTQAVNFAAG